MEPTLATDADVLRKIEIFCEARGIGVTTFGRAAIGDPNLVSNLRSGRSLTLKTANAVVDYIANQMAIEGEAA